MSNTMNASTYRKTSLSGSTYYVRGCFFYFRRKDYLSSEINKEKSANRLILAQKLTIEGLLFDFCRIDGR